METHNQLRSMLDEHLIRHASHFFLNIFSRSHKEMLVFIGCSLVLYMLTIELAGHFLKKPWYRFLVRIQSHRANRLGERCKKLRDSGNEELLFLLARKRLSILVWLGNIHLSRSIERGRPFFTNWFFEVVMESFECVSDMQNEFVDSSDFIDSGYDSFIKRVGHEISQHGRMSFSSRLDPERLGYLHQHIGDVYSKINPDFEILKSRLCDLLVSIGGIV